MNCGRNGAKQSLVSRYEFPRGRHKFKRWELQPDLREASFIPLLVWEATSIVTSVLRAKEVRKSWSRLGTAVLRQRKEKEKRIRV